MTDWYEWRISREELAQRQFLIVDADDSPFAFREAAILWAKEHGIIGTMAEAETGGKGCVGVSVRKIELLTGTIGNDLSGTAPNANTSTTNQGKANLHLTPNILLHGVVDVNGVQFVGDAQ